MAYQTFGMNTDAVRNSASKIDSLNSELDSIVVKLTGIVGIIAEECKGELATAFITKYQDEILSKLKNQIETFRNQVQATRFAADITDDTTDTIKASINRGV